MRIKVYFSWLPFIQAFWDSGQLTISVCYSSASFTGHHPRWADQFTTPSLERNFLNNLKETDENLTHSSGERSTVYFRLLSISSQMASKLASVKHKWKRNFSPSQASSSFLFGSCGKTLAISGRLFNAHLLARTFACTFSMDLAELTAATSVRIR